MVFYIDKSIAQEYAKRDMSEEELDFFNDLAGSCKHGKCFLCGALESLELLSQKTDVTPGRTYHALQNRYAEQGAILNAVVIVFVLTLNPDAVREFLPEVLKAKPNCQVMPVSTCISEAWSLLDGPCLLGENLDDVDFFELIGRHYCLESGMRSASIRFRKENGGGSTIKDVLKYCVFDEKQPTLCFVDSDRKYAQANPRSTPPIGETLKKAQEVADRLKENPSLPPFCFTPLHVHEIENLIPLSVLSELQSGLPGIVQGLGLLVKMKTVQDGEPLLYYDIKKGFSYISDQEQRNYWKQVLTELGGQETDMPPVEKQSPEAVSDTRLFIGLGSASPLRRATEYIKDSIFASGKRIDLDDYLRPSWSEIGVLVFSWGCACEPLRA